MNQENFSTGFRLIFENAKRLFNAAENLAKTNEFAIANSLLILSAEESIKAYAVLFQTYFPSNTSNDFQMYFSNHKHKLGNIDSFTIIFQIEEKYNELVFQPIMDNHGLSIEELKLHRKNSILEFVGYLKSITENKNNSISKQSGWWKQAESKKENGFYVGYKRGKWLSPVSITEKEYSKSKMYVGDFMKKIEFFYIQNSEDLAETISFFKNHFGEIFTDGEI